VSPACIADVSDPAGPVHYDCDFRTQMLNKVMHKDEDTDTADVRELFKRMQFSTQTVNGALATLTDQHRTPDAACDWIRQHPKEWAPWFTKTTPRTRVLTLSTPVFISILSLASVYLVFTFAAMTYLYYHRAHPVIRRASYLFCQLILVGACVFYVALMVGVQTESNASCLTSQFLISVAFSLFYGSLLVKTFRIYLISFSTELHARKQTDQTMLFYLLCFGAIDLAIVVLWALISPPVPTPEQGPEQPYTRTMLCSSHYTPAFSAALYLWRSIAVVSGGVLSIRVRGVDDDFSESKFLGAACYNIIIFSAPLVGWTLIGSRAPEVSALSWLFGVTLAVFGSSIIFMVPKRRAFIEYSSRMYTVSSIALTPLPHGEHHSSGIEMSPRGAAAVNAAIAAASAKFAATQAAAMRAAALAATAPQMRTVQREHPLANLLQSRLPDDEERTVMQQRQGRLPPLPPADAPLPQSPSDGQEEEADRASSDSLLPGSVNSPTLEPDAPDSLSDIANGRG
jgi:hypothetical protein